MTLKESYTYQNFLDSLINNCWALLKDRTFVTTTTEKHKLSEANPGTADRVVVQKSLHDVDYNPIQVVDFLVELLDEKDKISSAIAETKKNTEIDIDKSMAMNKKREVVINLFKWMADLKPLESETYGSAYRLNPTSGSQEKFQYVIENVTSINFDRKDINGLVKKYKKMNDELSKKKDLIELTVEVDFTPKYDIDSTFDELVVA